MKSTYRYGADVPQITSYAMQVSWSGDSRDSGYGSGSNQMSRRVGDGVFGDEYSQACLSPAGSSSRALRGPDGSMYTAIHQATDGQTQFQSDGSDGSGYYGFERRQGRLYSGGQSGDQPALQYSCIPHQDGWYIVYFRLNPETGVCEVVSTQFTTSAQGLEHDNGNGDYDARLAHATPVDQQGCHSHTQSTCWTDPSSQNTWTDSTTSTGRPGPPRSRAHQQQLGQYTCMIGTCGHEKPFRRIADLDRHYKIVHMPEHAKPKHFCDYGRCERSAAPFSRKDHLRDHLREYHKEDIPKIQERGGEVGGGAASSSSSKWRLGDNIRPNKLHWRCGKCLARVWIMESGSTCPTPGCGSVCVDKRLEIRGYDPEGIRKWQRDNEQFLRVE